MEILAIVPARSGSKGIPKKNIKMLISKPLIEYSIEAAIKSKHINKVVVSTDDPEIKKVSGKHNIEVINRPKELANDDSPTIDTVKHSLSILEEGGYIPDILVLLQPTSPLRTSEDIDNSIEIFIEKDCDSVIGVCEFEHSPYWSLKIENGYLKPVFGLKYLKTMRQELSKFYTPNGAIFISKPYHLSNFESFYYGKVVPYIMSPKRSVDIDTELDFKLAEILLSELNESY